MALYDPSGIQRNREWRRLVRVKARVKSGGDWRDASILNVSSHGLMIHSASPCDPGKRIEVRSGDRAFCASVVWRKGERLGLRSDAVLPILDIVGMSEAPEPLARNPGPVVAERRKTAREDSTAAARWPRLLELGSTIVIAATVVSGFLSTGTSDVLGGVTEIAGALRR
jgi:PilZ domain